MISYEGILDALTAVLVILIVSLVITVAWLSTYVREQPLVATAVVLFQSNDGEGQTQNGSNSSSRESPGTNGAQGSEVSQNISDVVKDKGNLGVPPVVMKETRSNDVCESGSSSSGQSAFLNSPKMADHKDINGDAGACSLEPTEDNYSQANFNQHVENDVVAGDQLTGHSTDPITPSSVIPSDRRGDEEYEMQVRNRRLQHFISMGKSSTPEETKETISSSPKASASDVSSVSDNSVDGEVCSNVKDSHACSSPVSASEPSSSCSEEEEKRPPGSIKIRLKFLDETQKYVFAQLTEQVGSFKRQHFSIEMDANRRIRLIFNGQLLSEDSSTLAQYGLFDNCVVHCHVSQPLPTRSNGPSGDLAAQQEEDAYVSGLLAPLLYCVMVVMWYLRYEYGHLFNTVSTVILLFLTALLLVSTYLLYVTQNVPDSGSATAQVSTRPQSETQSRL